MRRLAHLLPWVLGLTLLFSGAALAIHQTPPLEERVANIEATLGISYAHAEPTVEPTATPTHDHEPQPGLTLGWHGPEAHDGLNVHEHGDEPPAWVYASDHQPFTQTRESHAGYKGTYDVSPGGVESYFIAHVISTVGARSHGNHDYQLWLRDPETGQVFFVEGHLCFTEDERCTEQPVHSVVDDSSIRPVIQSVGDGGCETWYSDPGAAVIDVGYTICGRYQTFDGTVTGDTGTFRTIDWVIPCSRLPADNPMQDNCRIEFRLNRLSFIVNSKEYDPAGLTQPVN